MARATYQGRTVGKAVLNHAGLCRIKKRLCVCVCDSVRERLGAWKGGKTPKRRKRASKKVPTPPEVAAAAVVPEPAQ